MHPWDVTPREAVEIQRSLAGKVVCRGRPGRIGFIAGVDIAFDKDTGNGFCGIIVFTWPFLGVVEERFLKDRLLFPYVPGLLSFREGPLFLKTFSLLDAKPGILVFDGQGIAHPRGLGIASHMGVILGLPTIGCAKSRLYGTYEEPGPGKGSRCPLYGKGGDIIGVVLRTRSGVRPVFVSPGHRIGIEEAADIMMECAGPYRVPVPTREAHIRVGRYRGSCAP